MGIRVDGIACCNAGDLGKCLESKGPRINNFTFLHLIFRLYLSDFHSLNPHVAQVTLAVQLNQIDQI